MLPRMVMIYCDALFRVSFLRGLPPGHRIRAERRQPSAHRVDYVIEGPLLPEWDWQKGEPIVASLRFRMETLPGQTLSHVLYGQWHFHTAGVSQSPEWVVGAWKSYTDLRADMGMP